MADPKHEVRPWGEFWVLDDGELAKVKRLEIRPGKRLSYQRHRHRDEHWYFVRGRARVTLDDREHLRGPGDTFDVPRGGWHRIENVGDEPVVFIEVQTGTYFGEDDIERKQDDFGRV
jgi:mannose-6-phosphate isomerase-like protein (cupin superfamily)